MQPLVIHQRSCLAAPRNVEALGCAVISHALSKSEISRRLRISRTSVRRFLAQPERPPRRRITRIYCSIEEYDAELNRGSAGTFQFGLSSFCEAALEIRIA